MKELPSQCHNKDLCGQLSDEQSLQELSLQELFGLSFVCGGTAIEPRRGVSCPEMNKAGCSLWREDRGEILWKLIQRRRLADSINPN